MVDIIKQGSDQWFAQRLGKFSASTFGLCIGNGTAKDKNFTLTGLSLIREKISEKLTGKRAEVSGKALEWGTDHEGEAVEFYEKVTGMRIKDAPFVPLKGYEDWAGGSPDGFIEPCLAITSLERKRLYWVYHAIRQRCMNPHNKSYENYGGRGIHLCKEWNDYKVFEDWCLSNGYSDGLVIDRKDNDVGYSPENCRFISQKENNRNKRNNILDNSVVEKIKKDIVNNLRVRDVVEKYGVRKNVVIHIKKLRQWVDVASEFNAELAEISDIEYTEEEMEEELPERNISYKGICEIKCPFISSNHIASMVEKNIPKKAYVQYYTQIQFNMLCTDTDFCDFISYDPRMIKEEHKIYIKRIPRDEEYITKIKEKLDMAILEMKETLSTIDLK